MTCIHEAIFLPLSQKDHNISFVKQIVNESMHKSCPALALVYVYLMDYYRSKSSLLHLENPDDGFTVC